MGVRYFRWLLRRPRRPRRAMRLPPFRRVISAPIARLVFGNESYGEVMVNTPSYYY